MAMRSKTEVLEETIEKAIDNFSDNYADKIAEEGKLSFTAEDIKTAYVEGAKWMRIFFGDKGCAAADIMKTSMLLQNCVA